MMPVMFSWGSLVIPSFGMFLALGYLIAAFLLWRRLRKEYEGEDIVTLTLTIGLWSILAARVVAVGADWSRFGWQIERWFSLVNYPGLSMHGAVWGALIASRLFCKTLKMKWQEVLDALGISGFWMMMMAAIGAFLSGEVVGKLSSLPWAIEVLGFSGKRHPVSVYYLCFWAVCLLWSLFFEKSYRRLAWYVSGKVGFVGWSAVMMWSIGVLILENMTEGGLYFGWYKLAQLNALFWLIFGGVSLYRLSERGIVNDRKLILKKVRSSLVLFKQKIRARGRKKRQLSDEENKPTETEQN